jgi:hypothetical protein
MTTVKEQKRKTIIPARQNNMGYLTQSMISPCHHDMAHLRFWMEEWLPIWRGAVNILNKQLNCQV